MAARAAGVDVVSFMPVRFPAFTGKVNYRNHRKICVVDGKVGYIGGMNLALRYAKGGRGRDWCDTGGTQTLARSWCRRFFTPALLYR